MLALQREYLAVKPLFVEILHIMHLLTQFTEVDKLEISDPTKCFLGISEILLLQRFNAESSPVLLRHTKACQFVRHIKLMLLEESEESRRLWHVYCVHIIVIETKDF